MSYCPFGLTRVTGKGLFLSPIITFRYKNGVDMIAQSEVMGLFFYITFSVRVANESYSVTYNY